MHGRLTAALRPGSLAVALVALAAVAHAGPTSSAAAALGAGGEGEGGGAAAGTGGRYRMRQQLVSFGDDFWIENDRGERRFKVNGRVARVRETLDFEDAQGNVGARIQERMLRVRDTMAIEGPGGEKAAEIKKAVIGPLRDRWTVRLGSGPDLKVQGDILDHEYTIGEGGQQIAKVSKKWFRVRDTYGVEIAPGQNDIVILAVAVGIDEMAHAGR